MNAAEIVEARWRTSLSLTLRTRAPGSLTARQVGRARRILGTQADRVEIAASRFRRDSCLAQVNRCAGRWVGVSPLLVELVEVALAAAEATDGLVDPCLGQHVDAAGYRAWSVGEPPPPTPVAAPRPSARAWQDVDVGPRRVRVPPGVSLDLGATAKAWLADEVAERVAEDTSLDVVANMGGDLRALAHDGCWEVAADHEVPGLAPVQVEVRDAGLATSGQGRRRWLTPTGPAHHIIDPRTGRSAVTSLWAVSAVAASATSANVAATAGMLLDDAPAWFVARGLDGVFTQWAGTGLPASSRVGRWPTPGAAA